MKQPKVHENQTAWHFLVFLLSLGALLALYFSRHLDDNRLTSWRWVFHSFTPVRFSLVMGAFLVSAWLFCLAIDYKKKKPLLLFVAAFGAASLFWSEPEVIVDAARYFTQAKQLHIYGIDYFASQWGGEIFAWTDLPLVPFLYGIIFRFLGEHRILIQLLNTFFYAMTVVLTYMLGKNLWNEEIGFRGGMLLLGIPYLYTQVPLMLVDVPTMFFFMLAAVTSTNALQRGGTGRITLAAFAVFTVFYAKYTSWILLTLIPIIYIYQIYQNPLPAIRRGVVLALLSLLITGTVFVFYWDVFIPQVQFLIEYQKPGLGRWTESWISTFLFQVHPFITAAAIVGLLAALRKTDVRFILVCFLLLVFLFMQVKRIRYTLPVFPMLALMASYGMDIMQNRKLLQHVVLSIVFTSFAIAFLGFLPFLKTLGVRNLQTGGRYLNSLPIPSAEVITLSGDSAVVNPATSVPVLDIYTDKKLFYAYEPPGPEVLARVRNLPLRFTWEFPIPGYYLPGSAVIGGEALVIISDDPDQEISQELENRLSAFPAKKIFQQSSYVFQHQTFVTVYHK